MRLRTFFIVVAVGAVVNSTLIRAVGLMGDAALAASLLGMVVIMLACFPFLDPAGDLGRGSGKR